MVVRSKHSLVECVKHLRLIRGGKVVADPEHWFKDARLHARDLRRAQDERLRAFLDLLEGAERRLEGRDDGATA
jgi:hypothetical protein